MASKEIASRVASQVKPFFSSSHDEARRRAIHLYREWQRTIPQIHLLFDIPVSQAQMREKVRQNFRANKNINDIRMIDALVWRGQMDLRETREMWKTRTHVMLLFGDENNTPEKKATDFLSRFYEGQNR